MSRFSSADHAGAQDASPGAAPQMPLVNGDAISSLDRELASDVALLKEAGLFRRLKSIRTRSGALVECDGRRVVDFASNDYLGIASDPRVSAAACAAARESVGAGAARLISGNHPLHEELELRLARFKRSEAALLFPSGYAANTGAIPSLVGKRDVIYADELNHASLIDACRLSRATIRVVPHCDVAALRGALEADRGKFRRRMIVVDAVFSMDGDLYPLRELIALGRQHDAWTYVDDAHGTGVQGENGRGSAEFWGVEKELDVVMATLGKAIGVAGAAICGSRVLVEFLTNRARSFVYTTGSPPLVAAAAIEALRIAEHEQWRREKLRTNARRLRGGLAEMGFPQLSGREGSRTDGSLQPHDGHIVAVPLRSSETTMRVGAELLQSGFLVGAIRPPTVPMGSARLRITASAAHDEAHISGLLHALESALKARDNRRGRGSGW